MKQLCTLAFVVALAGCRCGGTLKPGQSGFRVDPLSLDFDRVLEGQTAMLPLNVISTGTISVDVDISVAGAGFLAPQSITVAGGSTGVVMVSFLASNVEATGTLSLTAHGSTAAPTVVPLHAIGKRPLVCTPSAPCKVSNYSLSQDACIEGDAPEQSQCTPTSLCLENGRCHMGICEGTTRSCDDMNKCTDDSCSEQVGCVNTMHSCPNPTELCHVATCDPGSGCGSGNAGDLTPCGPVSCTNASLCFVGNCMQVAPPDGFQCSPATPCQGPGHCSGGNCELPDASVMTPTFTLPLIGKPVPGRPSLLAFNGNVYFLLCGVPVPPPDAGVDDGGLDGGGDAGLDGGSDAGLDGGFDAGAPDAGPLLGCVLESFTSNGFERWGAFLDAGIVSLANVSGSGALVVEPGGVELVAIGSGSPSWFAISTTVAGTAATAKANDLLLTPPSLSILADGGLSTQALSSGASVLAIDENDTRWLWEPDAGTLSSLASDGGFVVRTLVKGTAALATAQGAVLAGHNAILLVDGGVVFPDWTGDEILPRPVMAGQGTVVTFHRECSGGAPSCTEDLKQIIARSYSVVDGGELFESLVTGPGTYGSVEEASLLDPIGMTAVVQSSVDAGLFTYLEMFAFGSRGLVCQLANGLQLGGALFNSSTLWLLDSVDGGTWRLESYDLANLPLASSEWPVSDGVSGQRRAR